VGGAGTCVGAALARWASQSGKRPRPAHLEHAHPPPTSFDALLRQGVAAFSRDLARPLQALPPDAWAAATLDHRQAVREMMRAALERTPGPTGRRRHPFHAPELAAAADVAIKRGIADGALLAAIAAAATQPDVAARLGAIDLTRLLFALARAVDTAIVPSAVTFVPQVAALEALVPTQSLHLDLSGVCSVARSLHALGSRNVAAFSALASRLISLLRAGGGASGVRPRRDSEGGWARDRPREVPLSTLAYALTAFAAVNMRSMRSLTLSGAGYALCTPADESVLVDALLSRLPAATEVELCTLVKALGTLGVLTAESGPGSPVQTALAAAATATATAASAAGGSGDAATSPRIPVRDPLWDSLELRARQLLPSCQAASLALLAAGFSRATRLANAEVGLQGDSGPLLVVGSLPFWGALHDGIMANIATLQLAQLSHVVWAFSRLGPAPDHLLAAVSARVAEQLSATGGDVSKVDGELVTAAANLLASYAHQPSALVLSHAGMMSSLLSTIARAAFEAASAQASGGIEGHSAVAGPATASSLRLHDLTMLLWSAFQTTGLLGRRLPLGTQLPLAGDRDGTPTSFPDGPEGVAAAQGQLKALLAALSDTAAPILSAADGGGVLKPILRSLEQLTVSTALLVATAPPATLVDVPMDVVLRLLLCCMTAHHNWALFMAARATTALPAEAAPLPTAGLTSADEAMIPDPELGVVDSAAAALRLSLRSRGIPEEHERRGLSDLAQGRSFRRVVLPAIARAAARSAFASRPAADGTSGMRAAANAWALR